MVHRRRLSFIGFILLSSLLVLSACSDDTTSKKQNGDKGNKPVEITIMTPLHSAETPDPKLEELIEEKTGVQLNIQWIPANNYVDKMNSAFATENLPDVANISMEGPFKQAIRDGQFWEIGPFLDEFENLSKLKDDVLENTMVDGKLYALYQGRPLARQGLIYRKDWADKLGISTPTNVDELYEMLRAFTEDDPDGNGKDDTIGLADREDLNFGAFKTMSSWFGTPNEWGMKDGELQPAFTFPEYKQTMDFMKELHQKGYINQDFPITSKTDQQAMIKNGTAGAYIGCMCDVQGLFTDGVQLNPNMVLDVQNKIEGPHGGFAIWSIPGFNHPYLFPKSSVKTEEELKQILGFFDKLMDPEIANLLFWGIEGEHYEVVDGKAIPNDDQTKINTEIIPYQTLEVGEPETNGRFEGNFDYETREKAEQLFKDNENYLMKDPTVALDSETFNKDGERLTTIMKDATYNYILGDIDEAGFEDQIKKWKEQGGDNMVKEFNASYKQAQ
ncbi:extracellular solute-binding protein [Bacillus sinesaloumensis]|uniref:extracellular solute-binding protein n=1 Tax=Litchfieldia sinesaloumensis TaxID=1926280 RepID=UPI0009886279|nr:extracellular solute-binding protein [Bacillus sinesaloumensis]